MYKDVAYGVQGTGAAMGAVWGGGLPYAVEVRVEGDVPSAGLYEQGGMAPGKGLGRFQ